MSSQASPAKGNSGNPSLALKRRARRMSRMLAELHPDAHCELDYQTPFQLAVATILSAQCTDARVNATTTGLFARFPDATAMAGADRTELEELIRPTGFFRNKANSLLGLSAGLLADHRGELPSQMDQLVQLPGIGRKTAHVILGEAFARPAITVDTHMARLVRRFEWTQATDPVKIENVVAELLPREDWTMFSHRVIFHGRRVCFARKPACGACALAKVCPSFGTGPTDPHSAVRLLKGPRVRELAAAAEVPAT